jgi:hypothetical protein
MNKKLAIAKNMLSPYWHDVFEMLSKKGWDITIFVAVERESNRRYNKTDYTTFSFNVVKSRNIALNLQYFTGRADPFHIHWGLWRELKEFGPHIVLSNQLGSAH